MIILSVHSTTPHLGVAISIDGVCLAEKVLPPGKRHLENLPALVSEALEDSNLSLGQVEAFAAALGPGSFSGVRIGLAAIKGYCLALSKPIVGISSLDILLYQAAFETDSAIAVIDAGRQDVYAGYAKSVGDRVPLIINPVTLAMMDFPKHFEEVMRRPTVICGDHIIEKLVINPETTELRMVEVPLPSVCGILAHHRILASGFDDVFLLNPLYMKKSDAERNASKSVSA